MHWISDDRAIAQVVSVWLPTVAARVRSEVRSCEICGGQWSTRGGFLQVLRFPLPILIPPIAPQSLIIASSMLYTVDTSDGFGQFIQTKHIAYTRRSKGM
jgi:hypothetical protein